MTKKRFTMSQNGNFHTVRDTVEKKPLGMFEFKENEFPVYACFHHIIDLLNEFYDENEQLKKENQRMTDKLNELALEFLNYDMVSMGKATEISEMCYYDFLKYRKDNGNPMELQL